MSYFVTGALGCIGAWIVKTLVERGDAVTVVDRSGDVSRLSAIMEPQHVQMVEVLAADITHGNSVRAALERSGASRIIHLAGLQVPTCRAKPVAGALVNVVGTLNLFEAARTLGLDRIVYASSAAVFGLSEDGAALDESAACEPTTHYGVFKRANEGNARVYFLDHGLSSVGLRPLTVYGVGRDTGLTSDTTKAMKAAVAGRPFHVRFGGATDFQYVADTAAAFIACAERAPAGAFVFNLHGETAEVAEAIRLIDEHLPPADRGRITCSDVPLPVATALSDAAIRTVIGDLPSTPLAQGIAETMGRFAALRDAGRLDTRDLDE